VLVDKTPEKFNILKMSVAPSPSSSSAAHLSDSAASPSTAATGRSKTLLLDSISKRFGDTVALQPMTLEVRGGEMLALLGPSGCGKTTTLRCIAGFEAPNSGRVLIGGEDVTRVPPNKRGLGMVFQNYSLFPHLSVGQNIGFGLKMAGRPPAEVDAQVQRMLTLIQLQGFGDRSISQLSGGQQQRVALARALITNPKILLLDEPLGALDKNLREGMQFELRRLQRELGITSVLVTHDQEEALTMSDRVVVMNKGQILQIGPPREVYERPRSKFVAEFLGTANILTAQVVGRRDKRLSLKFYPTAQEAIEVGVPDDAMATSAAQVMVALRPEKLSLQGGPGDRARFPATVKEHVFRGSQHAYMLTVPALQADVIVHEQASSGNTTVYRPGDAVEVSFAGVDVVLLDDPVAHASLAK
jgi:putative spermidine/putrescine transport system ATP-binding protein